MALANTACGASASHCVQLNPPGPLPASLSGCTVASTGISSPPTKDGRCHNMKRVQKPELGAFVFNSPRPVFPDNINFPFSMDSYVDFAKLGRNDELSDLPREEHLRLGHHVGPRETSTHTRVSLTLSGLCPRIRGQHHRAAGKAEGVSSTRGSACVLPPRVLSASERDRDRG